MPVYEAGFGGSAAVPIVNCSCPEIYRLLEDAPNGTLLSVVESGFDGIPAARRAKAHEMHEQGWAMQMKSIAEYLVKAA